MHNLCAFIVVFVFAACTRFVRVRVGCVLVCACVFGCVCMRIWMRAFVSTRCLVFHNCVTRFMYQNIDIVKSFSLHAHFNESQAAWTFFIFFSGIQIYRLAWLSDKTEQAACNWNRLHATELCNLLHLLTIIIDLNVIMCIWPFIGLIVLLCTVSLLISRLNKIIWHAYVKRLLIIYWLSSA